MLDRREGMIRRPVLAGSTALACLVLAACGGGAQAATNTSTQTKSETRWTLILLGRLGTYGWFPLRVVGESRIVRRSNRGRDTLRLALLQGRVQFPTGGDSPRPRKG